MNDLLKKIYEDVLMYENDVVQTNRKADEKINRLIEPYREHLSESERDSFINLTDFPTNIETLLHFKTF